MEGMRWEGIVACDVIDCGREYQSLGRLLNDQLKGYLEPLGREGGG